MLVRFQHRRPLNMTKQEYYKILFELGLLDDEEDWQLYQLQEERYNDYPVYENTYLNK